MMRIGFLTKTARLLRLEQTADHLAQHVSVVDATRVHEVDRAHDASCRRMRDASTIDERARAHAEVKRLEQVILFGYQSIEQDGAR